VQCDGQFVASALEHEQHVAVSCDPVFSEDIYQLLGFFYRALVSVYADSIVPMDAAACADGPTAALCP
jgi:hypothetical protein